MARKDLVIPALAALFFVAMAGAAFAITPLHEAAMSGNAAAVKAWIAQKRGLDATYDEPTRGLEGNYARARGLTALMTAARAGQLEIVKLLAEGGANLYLESHWPDGSNPHSAFDYAVEAGRVDIAEYLWTRSDRVRFAARLDRHIVATCVRLCDEKSGTDARTNLALFLISITSDDRVLGKGLGEAACYAPQPLQMLAFLEKRSVRFPKNTLHCVAYYSQMRGVRPLQDRIAMATFFLDHGADPNDGPYTPLKGAAAAHDSDMVKFLLSRGGDPNRQGSDGITAIGAAANSCTSGGTDAQLEPRLKPQLATIELLAQSGSDPKFYATPAARSRLNILTSCCSRKPQAATQQRICAVFGL